MIGGIITGIPGGFVGGWLFGLLGIGTFSWIGEVISAVIGAVIVLWVFAQIKG